MLKLALENIEQHFIFVGIQEHFEESMILLNEKLNVKIKYLSYLNKANANHQIDQDLVREIEKQNQIDVELYNIMKNKFFEELKRVKYLSAKRILLISTNKIKETYNKRL